MEFQRASCLRRAFSIGDACARTRKARRLIPSRFEILEGRELLSTFTVTNLRNTGSGSLREAIIESNAQSGANTIGFSVAGTIRIKGKSLPAITNTVTIDGESAPSFAGSPVVTVNFQGTRGLTFAPGSDGSDVESLSLVKAGKAGVTISSSNVTVQGNYIGLLANGTTVAGNWGDGVQINASSRGDLIGKVDPVSSVDYYPTTTVYTSDGQPMTVSGWQGIREGDSSDQYIITGTSDDNGLLYIGPISGIGGTAYPVNYPNGAATTSVYGPDNLGNGELRLVGSYTTGSGQTDGFMFRGTVDDLNDSSDYTTIEDTADDATYTYIHSTDGDMAVGNDGDVPAVTDHAFVYSISQNTFTDIAYPGATSTSAYGVWFNGGTSYTICGGYTSVLSDGKSLAAGYLVNYNEATGQFTDWTSYNDPDGQVGQSLVAHFQGISSPEAGVYTLSANVTESGSTYVVMGAVATVRLNTDGSLGPAVWTTLSDPNIDSSLTGDSIAGNQVVGISSSESGILAYQATINTGFQLSNVISGNGGNGIGIYGADDNMVAMNNIGTNAAGTQKRGNVQNGILVTKGALGNVIGGQATGGNDPTASVIIRPPQGNLISGNRGNGVLITKGATQTLLSGNFVGTAASGDSALGNKQDGVAIVKANDNELLGCTFQQSPFVFYNVMSGNGGNGLRITNSNDTTVQANFMGTGANNSTPVANHGDGLLVSGSSQNTQVGGPIPLGNVASGNDKNGEEVSGKASGFVSFNTFAGVTAFGGRAANGGDGILVTSTGGNNLIRTSITSGNDENGVEIAGRATGVQVTDTTSGFEDSESGIIEVPNVKNGIEIDGRAHGNSIGGFQASIEPQVTVSDNGGYGIAVEGSAHSNFVYNTYIGTSYLGAPNMGNRLGGVYLGPGTSGIKIGGTNSALQVKIFDSGRPGVMINKSNNDSILGDQIGGNGGDGVMIMQAKKLTVGGSLSSAGNAIVRNQGYGLEAFGACYGTVVQNNAFVANTQGSVNLTKSRGVTYIPGV
jgi:hypothetical protein